MKRTVKRNFESLLNAEIESERERQREFEAESDKLKLEELKERNRINSQHLSFKQLVEETHRLLRPLLDQFIQTANKQLKEGRFRLVAERVLARDSLYSYKVQKVDKTGVKIWLFFDTSIDVDVANVHFGYNFYDTLFVVRMETAASIYNYAKDEVLAEDFSERFARDLVHESGFYMKPFGRR